MSKHIVLVEPNYYTKYPPIGLLKISTFEKNNGNTTELVRKLSFPKKRPDKIYVTSLFTWAWQPVWRAVRKHKAWFPEIELWLGGLYASLMPEHAKMSGADHIYQGIFWEVEECIPDYSLVPEWDASIVWASRGCKNKCTFCAVPKLEGSLNHERPSISKFIWEGHKKIIFFDNNILATKYWKDIFEEVIELNMIVDFNEGLDARLLNEDAAVLISKMKIPIVRLAYDMPSQKHYVKKAINLLNNYGISKRDILVYSLFNYTESPDEYHKRVLEILEWGAVCYPMRFQPCMTLKKDSYISPKWTPERLEMVQRSRRVIGYGGTFPPYEGLINKFKQASNFDEAFSLYPLDRSEEKFKDENFIQTKIV